jgi:uncharacterized protein with GYD domain
MAEGVRFVRFVVLLSLAEGSRSDLEAAVGCLDQMSGIVTELGGEVTASFMTHGRFDAVVAGQAPDVDSVTNLNGWIHRQGYFSSETLIGAPTEALLAERRPYTHS